MTLVSILAMVLLAGSIACIGLSVLLWMCVIRSESPIEDDEDDWSPYDRTLP